MKIVKKGLLTHRRYADLSFKPRFDLKLKYEILVKDFNEMIKLLSWQIIDFFETRYIFLRLLIFKDILICVKGIKILHWSNNVLSLLISSVIEKI